MIENFDIIAPLLNFPSDDTFYFVQVIKRKKENPEQTGNAKIIKEYFIDSQKYLLDKKSEIIKFCELNRARAYIHLNARSYKDVSFEALQILAERLNKGEYKCNKSIWATACGRRHSAKQKRWVVDIDYTNNRNYNTDLLSTIIERISECKPADTDKIIEQVPTVNGVHLITRPFDLSNFNFHFNNSVDIHKNNGTILCAFSD